MMERGQGLTPWTASNNSFGQGKQMRGHSNPNSIIQQKYLGNGTISTCKNRLGKLTSHSALGPSGVWQYILYQNGTRTTNLRELKEGTEELQAQGHEYEHAKDGEREGSSHSPWMLAPYRP